MCYTAIPGTTGLRSIHYYMPARRQEAAPKPPISLSTLLRRPLETVPIFSSERKSMSPQFISEARTDS